ncbi:hypothetical protein DV735_g469, partial [Chaetothyriales sp. CBS 134920]
MRVIELGADSNIMRVIELEAESNIMRVIELEAESNIMRVIELEADSNIMLVIELEAKARTPRPRTSMLGLGWHELAAINTVFRPVEDGGQKRTGPQSASKEAPLKIHRIPHGTREYSDPVEQTTASPRSRSGLGKTRDLRSPEGVKSWAGTITVADPRLVTAKDLLAEVADLEVDFTVTNAVLLFTPQLARFHTEDFVKRMLTRLCRGYLQRPSEKVIIGAVTGVVDKVPGSAYNALPGSPVSEGVSVILSNSFMSQMRHEADGKDEQPAVLRFSSMAGHLRYPSGNDQPPPFGTHELHLAMANTLFINGRHSTLAESKWKRNRKASAKQLKPHQGFRYVKDHMLHAGVPSGAIFGSITPLKALTEPRLIRTALGNIIREIEVDGKVVPAAQELEKSVPEFTKSHENVAIDGKVLVFALVRDPEARPVLNVRAPTTTSAKIKGWLDGGARLLRVTGGGGGWGQKKGLLSLEPSTGYGLYDNTKMNEDAGQEIAGQDDAGQDAEDMTQARKVPDLVKEGGLVQFFICVGKPIEASSASNAQGESDRRTGHTIIAGMIPQTESVPADGETSDGKSPASNTNLIKDVFGGLSEQGLGLVIKEIDDAEASYERGSGRSKREERVLSSTRFDVPNVRFEYKMLAPRRSAGGILERVPGVRRLDLKDITEA